MPVSLTDWHYFLFKLTFKGELWEQKSRPSAAGIADDEPTWTYLRRACDAQSVLFPLPLSPNLLRICIKMLNLPALAIGGFLFRLKHADHGFMLARSFFNLLFRLAHLMTTLNTFNFLNVVSMYNIKVSIFLHDGQVAPAINVFAAGTVHTILTPR